MAKRKEAISKNYYKGKVIKSVDELFKLSEEGKAVYHRRWNIKPAIVIMNMPCVMVARLIRLKTFYTIVK